MTTGQPSGRLTAFLHAWLGQWPPGRGLSVVGSEQRERPGWDGAVRPMVGVETVDGAVISVDRKSHNPLVVGKDGHLLKEVGTRARRDLEVMLGQRVRLELWVKVSEGWSDDERAVVRMGYGEST